MKPRNVAEYLTWQINLCGKKQLDIAKEIGFDKPNIITMIKQGKTKLPLHKIGKMAKAVGVDPVHLFNMCMNEYMPETWQEIQRILDQPVVTRNEMEIIETIRSANPYDPMLSTDDDRATLSTFASGLKVANQSRDGTV
jgi:hypothetical protein